MVTQIQRLLLSLSAALFALPLWAFDTRATSAWVYDMTSHTVLMDKNAQTMLPPASMSKLMTINMLFEALKDGRVTMDTTFSVSDRAVEMTARGGSTMYLQQSDRPTVQELINGIVINSGNDACIVVAEGLAGTEEAFAQQMTQRAIALGLDQSVFANSSGWPDPGQRMSMRDLGLLARRLIEEFPEYYPVFAGTEFNYKDRAPANASNRNPMLKLGIGADGLKTGHTQEAGYGIVGSVKQGERRIIFAISGMTSEQERAEESERIAAWAMRQFALKTMAKAGTRIAEADVHLGDAETVGLVPADDLVVLVPALAHDGLRAEVVYEGPLSAPIAKGQTVARLIVERPDMEPIEIPLVAETDVGKGGFLKRLAVAADDLRAQYLGGI